MCRCENSLESQPAVNVSSPPPPSPPPYFFLPLSCTQLVLMLRYAYRRQAVSIYLEATPRSIIGDSIAEKQRFIAQVASLQGGLPPLCLHFRYHQLRQPSNSSSGTILSNCSLCISSVNESSIELRALEHSIVASSHMCVWSDDSSALLLLSGGSQSKADDVDERLQSGLTAGGPSTARRICAVVHALILELRLVAALYRRTALQRLGELRQNTSRPSGSAVMGPRIGMAVSAAACLQVTRQQQQLDILLADLLEWEWPWVID